MKDMREAKSVLRGYVESTFVEIGPSIAMIFASLLYVECKICIVVYKKLESRSQSKYSTKVEMMILK